MNDKVNVIPFVNILEMNSKMCLLFGRIIVFYSSTNVIPSQVNWGIGRDRKTGVVYVLDVLRKCGDVYLLMCEVKHIPFLLKCLIN